MYSNASSPGPGYSPADTPNKKTSFFGSLKKALPKRAESPASTVDGSEAGTPQRGLFPSFSSGQRKREVIKKLEEETSMMQLQLHQQGVQLHQQELQLGQLQQQIQQEAAAKVDAQERLNMQYFKANLVADMLVMKLLDLEQGMQPGRGQQGLSHAVVATGPNQGAVVMEESSF